MFPDTFSLKSYEKYPDSNAVNKVIYTTLKPDGYLLIKNLKIYLTDFGIEYLKSIDTKKNDSQKESNTHSNFEKKEMKRLMSLKGFNYFIKNYEKLPLDIDCYEFYGITARTPIRDMKNKKRQIDKRIKNIIRKDSPVIKKLILYKSKIDLKIEEIINEHNSSKN